MQQWIRVKIKKQEGEVMNDLCYCSKEKMKILFQVRGHVNIPRDI